MCWLQYFHFNPAWLLRMLRAWPLLDFGIKEYMNKASFYLRRESFFWKFLKYHTWLAANFEEDRWEVNHIPSIMPFATLSIFIIWAIKWLWKKGQIPLQFWLKPREKKELKRKTKPMYFNLLTLKLQLCFILVGLEYYLKKTAVHLSLYGA